MKRFLKVVTILALFFVVVAYVLFRVVLFDPFATTTANLDRFVPKDVDLMVRRKELAKDFDVFPQPRFFDTLKLTDEWKALARTKLFREVEPKLGIEAQFAALEQTAQQVKPLDLTKDLIGREAMVLCRFKPDGKVATAAIVRGSFRAKFLVEVVKFGFARRSQGDLLQDYAEKDGVRSVTVNGQRVHLGRVDDAIVAGDDFDLVRDALELGRGSDKLSLSESPQYRSAVLQPSPIGRPLDFVVDVGRVCRRSGVAWPAASPGDGIPFAFARQFLVPERFGQAIGRLALGDTVELAFSVVADRVAMQPTAGGLLEGEQSDLAKMRDFVGKAFPPKVAAAGYLRFDVKELLHRIEALQPPEQRQMFNDFVANLKPRGGGGTFQPKSTVELLDSFAACVADECAFAIEPDEPYPLPASPETPDGEMQYPDPHWGPRVALIFPVSEVGLANSFVESLVTAVQVNPNAVNRVFHWSYKGLPTVFREIKTVDVDLPTFSIGVVELQKKNYLVVTTTGQFLNEIVQQNERVAAGASTGLQSELQWKQAASSVDGLGQGFLFVSTPNLRRVVSDYCTVWAEIETRPDWSVIRKQVEREFRAQRHLGVNGAKTSDKDEHQLQVDLDTEIEKREREWRDVALPARAEQMRGELGGLDLLHWLTLSLRLDERELKAKLRLATPAKFAADE